MATTREQATGQLIQAIPASPIQQKCGRTSIPARVPVRRSRQKPSVKETGEVCVKHNRDWT